MTRKQIEAAKKTLPPWGHRNPEHWRLDTELDCREMINSCLLYNSIDAFWRECEWRFGDKSYAAPFVRELGKARVQELVAEQEADFAEAIIRRCVYTDCEGLSYDSITWADEISA